jgi:hypothetical protein
MLGRQLLTERQSRPAASDIRGCWPVVFVARAARCQQAHVMVRGRCHRSSSPVLKAGLLPLVCSSLLDLAASFADSRESQGLVGCLWDQRKPLVGKFDHDGGDAPWDPLSSLEAPLRSLLPTLPGENPKSMDTVPLGVIAWGYCSMVSPPWRVGGG